MTLAGVAYLKGQAGLEKNVREAVRLFTKAADAGNVSAMSILGVMYMNGDSDSGLVQNYPEALKLLTRAVQMADNSGTNINLGSVQSMSALGIMYQNGLGVPQDLPRAADFYQRVIAAGAGDAFPQTRANLAIILKIRPDLKK